MTPKKVMQFAVGPIGSALLSLITLPIITWYFSSEDVGRFSMLQVVINFSVMFFSLAMHQSYVREYYEVNNEGLLLRTSIYPGTLLLFLMTIMYFILPFSISEILFNENDIYISIAVLFSIYFSFVIIFLSHVLRMQGRGLAFSLTQVMPKLMLVFFIGTAVLFIESVDYKFLVIGNNISLLTAVIVFFFLTRDVVFKAMKLNIDTQLLMKMLKFSLPLVAGSLAYWALTAIDRFFLKIYSGFEELGVYAVASTLASAATVLTSIFSTIWHPIVYRWIKDGVNPEKVNEVIENLLLVVISAWALVGSCSWLVVYFLPAEYEDVKYLLVACVSMPLLYLLSEGTGVGIGVSRRSIFATYASVGAFILNLILNYILIPIHGASGAAVASVLSFFVFLIIRTESSSYLWYSIPRLKLYFLLSLCVVLTICFVMIKPHSNYVILIWFGVIVITCLMYSNRIKNSFSSIKHYKGTHN